jgi:hypothetical protein
MPIETENTLEGVSLKASTHCRNGSCQECELKYIHANGAGMCGCIEVLAKEVDRLRSELLKRIDIWKNAPANANWAHVTWCNNDRRIDCPVSSANYVREVQKNIEQDIGDKYAELLVCCDTESEAKALIQSMFEEYEEGKK